MDKDTIIAPITAVGQGSVNVLRLSGEKALGIVNKYLNKKIDSSTGNRVYFAKLLDKKKNHIDDVLVSYFKKPASFTGEDVVEISCHGNIFITNKIFDLFLSDDIRMAEPGEFSKRAFLNGKIDLIQAEAIADLIASKNIESVDNSLKLLDGLLSEKIAAIKDELLSITSLLELQIDFSEEDIDFVSLMEIEDKINKTISFLNPLLNSFSENKHFNRSLRVVILGKPNVGKSSIMNGLLNQNRVIVSEEPGTTRDTIHEEIEINGFLYRFIDTAGIRFTENKIEKEGIERARNIVSTADMILLVIDASSKPGAIDEELYHLIQKHNIPCLILANKNDLEINKEAVSFLRKIKNVFYLSALKQSDILILKNKIHTMIGRHDKTQNFIITNKRQYEKLLALKEDLLKTLTNIKNLNEPEFIAFDLRAAIAHINELSGGISTEEILNNIFGRFCIGK